MGTGADYQAYLDTLRSGLPEGTVYAGGSPFFDETTGGYRNIPYGSTDYLQNLPQDSSSQTQDDPIFNPDGSYRGSGPIVFDPNIGSNNRSTQGMPPVYGPGKGGRMPGQYITGNQLYSGMPYGMSQPMGMFAPPMQPFNYGYSSQYMPNRGLMSGYSTGFGPYGGYQRPRFGGGKGGMRRPMPYQPMGGGKGGYGY